MSLKEVKMKKCRAEGCENLFPPFLSTDKYCSSQCFYNMRSKQEPKPRQPIRRVSKKHGTRLKQYSVDRKEFLSMPENKLCKINGSRCTNKANTIEHTKGRVGYADDWAREKGITLLNDERFWKAACLNCNLELENNDELSKAHQLSKIHDGKKI